ncbi:MAG TPA: lipopolysaccharide assembly protein LapB, partial [Gammaproteobacteria bacterium]
MLEWLWLLLPVAAASGWLIGRRGQGRGEAPPVDRALSADYFRGLNHLLNERPDKAIEVFIRMLEAEGETAEIHLALGSLFRRRGEVDRAIRLHQNLVARPSLTAAQRGEALLELGLDYTRAGLYDRAEAIFQDLVEMRAHGVRALKELLEIYQQEKEWQKAIDTARRLASETGTDLRALVAHFNCELAELAQAAGAAERALGLARKALGTDADCVRASLLLGDLEEARGNAKAALRAYRQVADQDPGFIPEVLERMRRCHATLGRPDDLRDDLQALLPRAHNIAPVLALSELIENREGRDPAARFLLQQLEQQPSLRGLYRVI